MHRLLPALLLLPATGCTYAVRGDECSTDGDCGLDEACVSGYCFEVRPDALGADPDQALANPDATGREAARPRPRPGWPVDLGAPIGTSSPAIATLVAGERPSVVVGSLNGLHVLASDGTPRPGWPALLGEPVRAAPAVAMLDPARLPDDAVVLAGSDTGLSAFSSDGQLHEEFPVRREGGVRATPAVGDLIRDAADSEVIAPTAGGSLLLIRANGRLEGDPWPLALAGAVTAPALADLTADGRGEALVSTASGEVFALGPAGVRPGWPARPGEGVLGAPSVADLDGDGEREIVVVAADGTVHVMSGSGSPVPWWPVELGAEVTAAPALGDVDGRPGAEIVVGDLAGRVHVLSGAGVPVAGWPVALPAAVRSAPALADLTGDGRPDVIVGLEDGQVYALDADGDPLPGWPVATGGTIAAGVAVGDLDGDGRADVVAGSDDGRVYTWELGVGSWRRDFAPWPMDRRGPERTGALP